MKRTTILVIALALVVVFSASAQRRGGMMGPAGDVEEVELSGRLRLISNELPVLVSGADEYTLRISPVLSSEFTATDGQQVSVSGFLMERPSRDLLGTSRNVMVRTIEIGGSRYVMPQGRASGPMMRDNVDRGPRRPTHPAAPRRERR